MRITGGYRPERHGDKQAEAGRRHLLAKAAARTRVTVGVDLGKMADYTAIVIGERHRVEGDREEHHTIRSIERLPLGTPYPAVADRVTEIMGNLNALTRKLEAEDAPGFGVQLVVDAGGVGVAVVDLFRERKLKPVPVTIVAGSDVHTREDGSLTVGKGHLITTLDVLLQTGRLHLPETDEADILESELMDYEREFTQAGNVTFNARSGKHDDVVLACALAVAIDLPQPAPAHYASRIAKGRW